MAIIHFKHGHMTTTCITSCYGKRLRPWRHKWVFECVMEIFNLLFSHLIPIRHKPSDGQWKLRIVFSISRSFPWTVYIYIYIYNEMHMHTTISHTFQYPYMTRSFCPKISSLLNHSQHCAVHASYIHLFGFPFLSNLVNGALTIWCSTEHNGFLRGGQFNWQSFWRIGAHQPCHRGSPLNASKWWWQFKLKIALLSISAWTCGIASYMTSVGDVLHHAVVMWLCLKVDHGLNCH